MSIPKGYDRQSPCRRQSYRSRTAQVAARCNALDYTGIVGRSALVASTARWLTGAKWDPVLIVGSFYPCIYYGFYCAPHFQKFYLTLISSAGIGKF